MEPVNPPNIEWTYNGRYYDPTLLPQLVNIGLPDNKLPLFPTDLTRGDYIFVRNWLEHFQRVRIREAEQLVYGFSTDIGTNRTKMLGQLFVDDPFPLLIFDSVIVHEIKNLYGETPLEQDFRAWKEKGNWDGISMTVERGLGRFKKREEPVLVWRTLKDAVNGWSVEEYRVYMTFSDVLPELMIGNMTVVEWFDAIRRGDVSVVRENYKESSVVNVTYKSSQTFKYGRR